MLAGGNSSSCASPRLQAPDAAYCLSTPISRASAVATAGRLPRKRVPSGGMPSPVAANWTAITTRRSTSFWLGSSPRLYGVVEAPRFSAGVLHTRLTLACTKRHGAVECGQTELGGGLMPHHTLLRRPLLLSVLLLLLLVLAGLLIFRVADAAANLSLTGTVGGVTFRTLNVPFAPWPDPRGPYWPGNMNPYSCSRDGDGLCAVIINGKLYQHPVSQAQDGLVALAQYR